MPNFGHHLPPFCPNQNVSVVVVCENEVDSRHLCVELARHFSSRVTQKIILCSVEETETYSRELPTYLCVSESKVLRGVLSICDSPFVLVVDPSATTHCTKCVRHLNEGLFGIAKTVVECCPGSLGPLANRGADRTFHVSTIGTHP